MDGTGGERANKTPFRNLSTKYIVSKSQTILQIHMQ